tara:strand:+ start:278 stop:706 length:429 start_codon:yes stop_codon:yes gene_type:complete
MIGFALHHLKAYEELRTLDPMSGEFTDKLQTIVDAIHSDHKYDEEDGSWVCEEQAQQWAATEEAIRSLLRSTPVFVLLHEHKHGTDASVYSSEKLAEEGKLRIVMDFRDEREVPESLSDEEALDNWSELTQEYFDIVERNIN